MITTTFFTGRTLGRLMVNSLSLMALAVSSLLCTTPPVQAAITVSTSSPAGSATQTLPDAGGPFDLNLPLSKNAVNTITVTASDASGHKVSQDIRVTQLSLDQIVVSQVSAERLSVQQIKQLVADGVIQLDNPANYNVSKFDIVLTIGDKVFPISVPVVSAINTPETIIKELPPVQSRSGGGGGSGTPTPDVVIFQQQVGGGGGGGEPAHIQGVIIIEGNIKSLKEFYTVRLLLMNTSGIFTLKNVTSSVTFPDGGLSSIAPADGVISFGDILPGDGGLPGQAERQFIIRGDTIGINRVRVNFGGTVGGPLIPDDELIPFNGSADTKVEVKGPPTFKVVVTHPDEVAVNVPYELKVDITDTGDIEALYSSLALDVGGAAELVRCEAAIPPAQPACTPIVGSDVRSFGDILPGQTVSATFTINPFQSGPISSCLGISDQNIALQVQVGNIGCLVGQIAPERGVPDGVPTVQVAPAPNLQGVSVQSPVTAFFSQLMSEGSIYTGSGGTFNVYDASDNLVPGKLILITLVGAGKTVAVWQAWDTTFGQYIPLPSNAAFTVQVTQGITNLAGTPIYNAWTSHFTTTGMGTEDSTPPVLNLGVEPPVNPSYVLPGQLVKIDAYAADQGSGVVRVELRSKDLTAGDGAYQFIDRRVVFKGDKPPYIFTIDSGKLIPGHTYQLLGTAYDFMTNSQDATLNLVIASSAAAPTIILPTPPALGVAQGISVTLTPDSVTGGVTGVSYHLDGAATPFKTVNLPPYQAGLGTLGLSLAPHTIRAVAVDALGQTGEASYLFNVVANPNKPQLSLSGAVNGATYIIGSSFILSGNASDPLGIKSLSYFLDGSLIATGSQPFSIATAGLSTGVHTIVAQAVNMLDVMSDPLTSSFTVVALPNGPAPGAPVITTVSLPAAGQVSVSGSSAPGARIDITNSTQKFGITVNANGSGNFSASIAASSGDMLSFLAYDYSTSQLPSAAATRSVPVAPNLTSISAAPLTLNFTSASASQNITVTGNYDDGSHANLTVQSTFSSSDPSVATVSASGQVAALKSGAVTITVSSGGQQAQVTVTASIVTLTSISAAPLATTFSYLGETRQLAVTANYSDGSTTPLSSGVTFSSGSNAVAGVTTGGLITAAGNGSTQITAYYPGVQPFPVTITVNTALDTPPQVQILTPTAGAGHQRGDLVPVTVRASDAVGGVSSITLTVAGTAGTFFSETRPVTPVSLDTSAIFYVTVPETLGIGSSFSISADAQDSGHHQAPTATIAQSVVDITAPTVAIVDPPPQTPYNYGGSIKLKVQASDAVGVTRIRYQTSGAFALSGEQVFPAAPTAVEFTFSIDVPFAAASPALGIVAYASDASNNERQTASLSVIIANADSVPPATQVTAVASPGNSASTQVTYQVTDGLADLDHVELYFRRNGIGSYNRYINPDPGYPSEGKYLPQSGATGTITFDSTKMGGDGSYEFYSIGVDKAGNREAAPFNMHSPTAYSGLAGYYPFNGTTQDQSGNGNNGTLNGATLAADRFGAANQAFSFNGSSNYIGIGTPVPAPLQIQGELTLAAWIYVNAYPGTSTLGTIVGCQHDPGQTGYAIHLDGRTNPDSQTAPAGHLHFQIGNGAWHTTHTNAQIPLNQWVHVAATRKANEAAKIYYNGALQPSASLTWDGSVSYTGAEFDIGRQSDYSNRYFNGSIDEAQVYNRALTAAEIGQLAAIVTPDQSASFNAGTNWTIIASPASAGEGVTSYDNQNIRVVGTTFTVDGVHSFKNLELLGGAVLTHSAATDSTTHNLNLTLWSLSIDLFSSIDLTGRGYRGGRQQAGADPGLTAGNLPGSQHGTGGSHGGLGSVYNNSGTPAPVYDSFLSPTDLGSGGGNWDNFGGGGAGGGLLLLNAINVANDNSIRANGALCSGSAAGDGGGGGLNITSATLSGYGSLEAKGGGINSIGTNVGTGGGGGRIAVNYLDLTTLDQTRITVDGAQGQYGASRASNGTIFLKQQSQGSGDLVVDGQAGGTAYTTLTIPDGYTFNNMTLRNSAKVVTDSPIKVVGRLLVTGNSLLTHSQGNEAGLAIDAAVVQVDAGSAIDATGRGYRGGTVATSDPGLTLGSLPGSQTGTGGSYGGKGGGYYTSSDSGLAYGDPRNPVSLGSGGGNWASNCSGGAGGGLVTIRASNALIVDGAIRADGGLTSNSAGGDGSGGSVLIRTSHLAGNGSISANGGGSGTGVGGGGGRVAVYCDYLDNTAPLGNLRKLSAFAGHGYVGYDNRQASAGTVYVKFNQGQEELFIDDNSTGATAAMSTPLTPIGSGKSAAVTLDTLTTDGQMPILPGGLTGLRLNPDLSQQESFAIGGNTANTISVVTPNEHGVAFATLAAANKMYGGYYRYDNLTFRRGGNLLLGDRLEVPGTLTLAEYGLMSHYAATSNSTSGLFLTLGALDIDSTSRIDVTGRGYRGGTSSTDPGRTAGNAAGSRDGAGGSHGGLGSVYDSTGVITPSYDSLTNPTDLGSGGGSWSASAGGAGGGRVLITANSIALDGSIKANGAACANSAAGDGAGGTINITAGSLTGAGILQANGGGFGTGGGGGRIAILTSGAFTLAPAGITAFGGKGQYPQDPNGRRGGTGTVFIRDVTQSNGALVIDGGNLNAIVDDTTSIPGALTFDSIVLRNNARVTVDSGLTVTGQLLVTGNSVLTHSAGNEAGLTINAKDVRIDAGSSLDATGRGYHGGTATLESMTLGGIVGSQRATGGSYGGKGGAYTLTRDSGLIYGDPRNPVYLGSGGGYWGGIGGYGGGRVTIHASNSLVVGGSIVADGGLGAGGATGDGSGGSVLITSSSLAGTGTVSASGAHASSWAKGNGSSGGGGRIAIYCDTLDPTDNFNGLRGVTAFAGINTYDDVPPSGGTVYFKYNEGAEQLYIDANLTGSTALGATPLPHIGSGLTVAATSDTLTLDGNVPLLPGGLAGVRLNPNTTQLETFVIKGNSGNTISVITPNENGISFLPLASPGYRYGGVSSYQNVTFRRGGYLLLDDPLVVTGTLRLAENGLMTHFGSTSSFTSGLTIMAGSFLIDGTSGINVTGRGYQPGHTAGNATFTLPGTGGSHGGLGGKYFGNGGHDPTPVYDSLTNPTDLGSGGGTWSSTPGAGGGRVLINAGLLALDGSIIADGAGGAASATGNGAGGSVNITATTLTGVGTVTAKGGTTIGTTTNDGIGGGGGRIAIRYGGTMGLNISVSGGPGNPSLNPSFPNPAEVNGSDGTLHREQR